MHKSRLAALCDSLIFLESLSSFLCFTEALLLDPAFDKQEWAGFCSANVRFHLVWSKGLERERRGVREGGEQLVSVNTVS